MSSRRTSQPARGVVRARDNPFASERLHALELRLAGTSWDSLLERLAGFDWRAAVVGPEGSGKTTLLEQLAPRLTRRGFRSRSVTLRRGQRRLPPAMAELCRRLDGDDLLLLDGADELSRGAWWRLCRWSRDAGGLIIATHRPGRLPTVHRASTSAELLAELVAELLAGAAVPRMDLEALFTRHRGDLRKCLRELYDVYAGR